METTMIEDEEIDLFEEPDMQPPELAAILSRFALANEENSEPYEICEELLQEVQEIGYTFDYDLGGNPSGLKKLENPSLVVGDTERIESLREDVQPSDEEEINTSAPSLSL